MTTSNFLGIPHTGHDKTDGWVHKGKHWLEHAADKAGDEAEDVLDKGASRDCRYRRRRHSRRAIQHRH